MLIIIKSKNQIRRRCFQCNNSTSLQKNSLQQLIKTRLSEIRSENYHDFIAETEKHPISIWKVTKKLRNRKNILPPFYVDNQLFSTDSDKANVFAYFLQSQYSPNLSLDTFINFHQEISDTVSNFSSSDTKFLPSTPSEISIFMHFLKNNKSPGGDSVGNMVLNILLPIHFVVICNIINTIMRLNSFSTVWK